MGDLRVTAHSLQLSGDGGGNLANLLAWQPFKRQELPKVMLAGLLGRDLPIKAKSEQRDQLRALFRLLPLNLEDDFNQFLKELSHPGAMMI